MPSLKHKPKSTKFNKKDYIGLFNTVTQVISTPSFRSNSNTKYYINPSIPYPPSTKPKSNHDNITQLTINNLNSLLQNKDEDEDDDYELKAAFKRYSMFLDEFNNNNANELSYSQKLTNTVQDAIRYSSTCLNRILQIYALITNDRGMNSRYITKAEYMVLRRCSTVCLVKRVQALNAINDNNIKATVIPINNDESTTHVISLTLPTITELICPNDYTQALSTTTLSVKIANTNTLVFHPTHSSKSKACVTFDIKDFKQVVINSTIDDFLSQEISITFSVLNDKNVVLRSYCWKSFIRDVCRRYGRMGMVSLVDGERHCGFITVGFDVSLVTPCSSLSVRSRNEESKETEEKEGEDTFCKTILNKAVQEYASDTNVRSIKNKGDSKMSMVRYILLLFGAGDLWCGCYFEGNYDDFFESLLGEVEGFIGHIKDQSPSLEIPKNSLTPSNQPTKAKAKSHSWVQSPSITSPSKTRIKRPSTSIANNKNTLALATVKRPWMISDTTDKKQSTPRELSNLNDVLRISSPKGQGLRSPRDGGFDYAGFSGGGGFEVGKDKDEIATAVTTTATTKQRWGSMRPLSVLSVHRPTSTSTSTPTPTYTPTRVNNNNRESPNHRRLLDPSLSPPQSHKPPTLRVLSPSLYPAIPHMKYTPKEIDSSINFSPIVIKLNRNVKTVEKNASGDAVNANQSLQTQSRGGSRASSPSLGASRIIYGIDDSDLNEIERDFRSTSINGSRSPSSSGFRGGGSGGGGERRMFR